MENSATIYDDPHHMNTMTTRLEEMRINDEFADVVIRVEQEEYPCHKAVLAAVSPYFKELFTEKMKDRSSRVVDFPQISPQCAGALLKYIYTGAVEINVDSAQPLAETAHLFQLKSVKEACERLLEEHVSIENCISLYRFAGKLEMTSLREKSLNMILSRFTEVTETGDFVQISQEELIDLLKDNRLNVKNEEEAYEAAIKWIEHSPSRKQCGACVLEHVRFPYINQTYITKTVVPNAPLLPEDNRRFVDESLSYHLNIEDRNVIQNPRFIPRISCGLADHIVLFGGIGNSNTTVGSVRICEMEKVKWKTVSSVPDNLRLFGCCDTGRGICITGGWIRDWFKVVESNKCWLFDVHLMKWNDISNMQVSRFRHRSVTCRGHIYSIGGAKEEKGKDVSISSVEVYSFPHNTWSELPDMPEGLADPQVVAYAGKIYVMGGIYTDNTSSLSVFCYDPLKEKWNSKSPLPLEARCAASVALADSMFVIGGSTNVCLQYKVHTDSWVQLTSPGYERGNGRAFVAGGRIYVCGGRRKKEKAYEYLDSAEVYDPDTGIWHMCPWSFPEKMNYLGLVLLQLPSKSKDKK